VGVAGGRERARQHAAHHAPFAAAFGAGFREVQVGDEIRVEGRQ
jgi:hypothetical protein